jgi:hypothetical protein
MLPWQERKGTASAVPPTPSPTPVILSDGAKRRVEGPPHFDFTVVAFLPFIFFSSSTSLAQSITIRVINGRNGRPIPNVDVLLQDATTNYTIGHAAADSSGKISFRVNPSVSIRPGVSGVSLCTKRPDPVEPSFSVATIRESGVVAPNTCGKLIVQPRAGELVLFYRPPTWWEKQTYK